MTVLCPRSATHPAVLELVGVVEQAVEANWVVVAGSIPGAPAGKQRDILTFKHPFRTAGRSHPWQL